MLKIYNHKVATGQIYETIFNSLLDYMPGAKFREVSDIQDADIILMSGAISNGHLQIHISGDPINLTNLEAFSVLFDMLNTKHRIIWLDTMGPSIIRDPSFFDPEVTGLRETDILISSASIPTRPNTSTNVFPIEKSIFRQYERFERKKGSVIISYDNIENNTNPDEDTVRIISDVMDAVSQLYVTKSPQLSDDMVNAFSKSLSKITCENLSYPRGLTYMLSKAEFVLSTQTNLGVEFMGIEGGMVGCQPIYPDTEFYRDIFDGTGVQFFDTENPIISLREIIQAGSKFDKKTTEAFRTKFSAEDTLQGFWDEVYELYSVKAS